MQNDNFNKSIAWPLFEKKYSVHAYTSRRAYKWTYLYFDNYIYLLIIIDYLEVATTFHDSQIIINMYMYICSVKERQKQGHKDSTSDIYWDSWDTGKTREKSTSLSISPSKRSSCSSVTLDSDAPLSSPSSDAGTESSRLSTLSTSDTDGGLSPKHSPQPYYFMKRSVSDDANLGTCTVGRTTIW